MRRFILLMALFLLRISLLSAKIFSFSDAPIDVIIPCVEKDLPILDHCIRGIRENGANIRRIIIVSNKSLTSEAEWFNECDFPFSLHDIASALAHNELPLTQELLQSGSRVGWYYQQLLKVYAPLIIPDISPNVLILDADVVFLKPVSFLNENFAGMYNPGSEYHIPYFTHAERLIPGFYKYFPHYSGISHHMIFQRPVIEALLEEVEENHEVPFWQIFCQLVDPKELNFSGASEYEIYFNYIFARSDQVSIRKLNWGNVQRVSDIEKYRQQEKLDYVCLHSYTRS